MPTTTYGDVPLLDPATGLLPDRFTPAAVTQAVASTEAARDVSVAAAASMTDAGLRKIAAGQAVGLRAMATRVGANTDLAASLTPDSRTRTVLLSGQADQVYGVFSGGGTWATGSQSSDTTRFKAGTASRRLLVPASGTYTCRYTASVTFPPASLLQAWVWVDDATKVTSIGFSPCSGWSRAVTSFVNGWNLLRFRASAGTLTNWGTSSLVQITIVTTDAVGVNIGEMWVESPLKAQFTFTEDRGYRTFVNVALPQLRSIGAPVTWSLDPAKLGTSVGTSSEVVTEADLATAYAAGDDMSIHGYTGDPTSTMTGTEITADNLNTLDWLQTRGYTRGSEWRAAWVQNTAPNAAVARPYYAAYATPAALSSSYETWPPVDKWNLGRFGLHDVAAAQIDAMFDVAQKTHGMVHLYTHGVDASLSGAIKPADWTYFYGKLSAAVAAGWLEVVTMSQLVARSGGIVR